MRHVSVDVVEIHPGGLHEVAVGGLAVAELRGGDTLDARGQRRVTGRERVVVVEVALLLGGRELAAEQHLGQHDVGLLEHLVAVDDERVVVQQKRVVARRRAFEVPRRAVQERVVLGVDPEALVQRDAHQVCGTPPLAHLVFAQPDRPRECRPSLGRRHGQVIGQPDRVAKVCPGHEVRVAVVVDQRRVLVGACDLVDAEGAIAGRDVVPQVRPQAGGLEHDLGATLEQERPVAGRRDVLPDRVGDVGVDVVLGRAGGEVRRRLLPSDGAPRIQRAALAHLCRTLASPVQDPASVAEQGAGNRGLRVGEERQGEDLGVPEVVTVVALARQALRGQARPPVATCGLEQAEQVVAHALLERLVAVDLDVGDAPEFIQDRPLLVCESLEPALTDRLDRLACPRHEPFLGDLERAVIAKELGEPDRSAGRDNLLDRQGDVVLGREPSRWLSVALRRRPRAGRGPPQRPRRASCSRCAGRRPPTSRTPRAGSSGAHPPAGASRSADRPTRGGCGPVRRAPTRCAGGPCRPAP